MSAIDLNDLRLLIDAFDRSDWQELTFVAGGDTLHLSRDPHSQGPAAHLAASTNGATADAPAQEAAPEPAPAASAPAPAPAAPEPQPEPAAAPSEQRGTPVESPSVGMFWHAPSPGAPPFVEVGQRVATGDVIGIVEVMKLMTHVTATVDGVVTAVLAGNGAGVQYGEALVLIDPAA